MPSSKLCGRKIRRSEFQRLHTNPVITPERVNHLAFPVLRQDNWRDNRNVRSYRRRLNLAAESVLSGIGVVSSGMSGA
jgi:hypothetical protein